MPNSFRSCSIAAAVCLLATVSSTSAAPLPSYSSSQPESLHPQRREPGASLVAGPNRYPVPIQRDVEVGDADSLESTPMDGIASYAIITQPTSPPMARPTGGILLASVSSGSNTPIASAMVGEAACSTAVRPPSEHGYWIAGLVLLSCTFVVATFTAFYLVYRPWRLNRRTNGKWSTVNLYTPPDTPKPKPRLSISLPDTDKALRHKDSTSTLYSISEEPTNGPSSRPPSYTKGPISLPDSPALAQCWPLSPSSSHRTVAEGQQSSFLPLR